MARRFSTPSLLACTVASIACGGDGGVAPGHAEDGLGGALEVATLELSPARSILWHGDTLRLEVVALGRSGGPVRPAPAIAYASDAPATATVSSTGLVTAITSGSAAISATVSVGRSMRRAVMTIQVLGPDAPNEVLLTAGPSGWQPSLAYIPVGGTVRWSTGPTSWSGTSNTTVYLMDADYTVIDSFDLPGGVGARRFDVVDTVRYCSGSCWDPPDFGVIYVR